MSGRNGRQSPFGHSDYSDYSFGGRSEPRNSEYSEHPNRADAIGQQTVENLLVLSQAEFEEYRRELAAATPGDPWLEHDRAAFAVAERMRGGGGPEADRAAAPSPRPGRVRVYA